MLKRRDVLGGIGAATVMPWLARPAFAADDAPAIVPIVLDERVICACGINGTGPYFFMIDTGATTSLIDEPLARQLKLQTIASQRFSGIGGEANLAVYRAHMLSIGGAITLPDVVLDGTDGRGLGKDVRGTLAAGALTGYDSVLDFDAGEWRIYRRGFGDLPGFTAVESTIAHQGRSAARIIATVDVDGQPFRCLVDTGAPGGIILYPEAARRTRFWNDATVNYAPIRGKGIGGQTAVSRLVRANRATIGPVAFERPLVRLDGGARGQRDTDGIIGLGLIRHVNLATDVRRGRLLVQRNQLAPSEAKAPTSGMWIDRDGDTLVVADVGHGSPAAAAGIVAGDRIVDTDFATLVRALGSNAGAQVAMTIEHGGQKRRVTIVLADYL